MCVRPSHLHGLVYGGALIWDERVILVLFGEKFLGLGPRKDAGGLGDGFTKKVRMLGLDLAAAPVQAFWQEIFRPSCVSCPTVSPSKAWLMQVPFTKGWKIASLDLLRMASRPCRQKNCNYSLYSDALNLDSKSVGFQRGSTSTSPCESNPLNEACFCWRKFRLLQEPHEQLLCCCA